MSGIQEKNIGLILKTESIIDGDADRYSRHLDGVGFCWKFLVKGAKEERWMGYWNEYPDELEGTFAVGDWIEYIRTKNTPSPDHIYITRNLSHEERIKNFEKEYKKRLALIQQTQNTGDGR